MDTAVIDINAETSPFVLFSISEVVYGISSSHVLSIEILSTPTPLVNAPPYTLGVLDFRGDMIPLIGMRQLFAQDARGEGLRNFMQSLRADYENWVQGFEEAVRDDRGLEVNFNDDNCKLGVWLADFDTQNNSLSIHVNRIANAYTSANRNGTKIAAMAKTDKEKALVELEGLKNTYIKEVLGLVDVCADAYLEGIREMLLVLNVNDMTKGIVVDEIVSVEYINQFLNMPDNSAKSKYVRSLARRDRDNSTVLLMDEELIIEL